MKIIELEPGHTISQPAMPTAGIEAATYEVLAVSAPYAALNGTTASTFVRIKRRNVATGHVDTQPYLADADVVAL